nr:putative wd repeat-containing protein c32h8.09 [Quercus suber]
MEISDPIGGTHSVTSPSGLYIASIASGKLRIHATSTPEQFSELSFRIPEKDIAAIKWAKTDAQILVFSFQCVEILDLLDPSHRVRLDNGSGGFGRFSSADFVTEDLILVVWEFGRSKLWNLRSGKAVDLNDVKPKAGGLRWQVRPCPQEKQPIVIAMLSRSNGEDLLSLYFPGSDSSMTSKKLHTVDARSLSWSADGRWIVVVDSPYAAPSFHIYTADGHHFRGYGVAPQNERPDPAVVEVIWSADHRVLAVSKNDGTITLLNTRTFSPIANIEHNTTINQTDSSPGSQASIWEEVVSASGDRTFRLATQPYSPPRSSSAKCAESYAKGVEEFSFNCDGSYLATRDERMLNTVWIWHVGVLAAHAVIVQHSNVKHVQWHPSLPTRMLVDCGQGIAYVYDTSSGTSPAVESVPMLTAPSLQWSQTGADDLPIILASTKTAFRVVYPEGRGTLPQGSNSSQTGTRPGSGLRSGEVDFEEGHSEDSLFDVLSGRKSQHDNVYRQEMSYTERINLETEEEDSTARLDDTFREKRPPKTLAEQLERDPLDDSQIF